MREKLDELARLQEAAMAEQTTIAICAYRRALLREGDALLEYVRQMAWVLEEAKKERDWYNEAARGRRELVRQLDVLMNGEHGAARQAALCDIVAQFPRWLAARDAQQRREGAAEALLEAANDRFGDGLFLPDRTHYTASEVSEILTAEAKRLREGK